MNHPILGKITESEEEEDDLLAEVPHGKGSVRITLTPDDASPEEAITFAAKIVALLAKLDEDGKKIASRDLRETYNFGWNQYDEVLDDGTTHTVVNPPLTDDTFRERLTLVEITTRGEDGFDLWYDCGQMFWGHSVLVTSSEDADLSNARASLFG